MNVAHIILRRPERKACIVKEMNISAQIHLRDDFNSGADQVRSYFAAAAFQDPGKSTLPTYL